MAVHAHANAFGPHGMLRAAQIVPRSSLRPATHTISACPSISELAASLPRPPADRDMVSEDHASATTRKLSVPVYQVGEPIADSTSDEQGGQRLFGRISAHISSRAGALLVRSGGGLVHLVSDLASDPLDRIARLRYSLNSGARCVASQAGSLVDRCPGACLQIPEHGLALIDLVLNHFLCLRGEVIHRVPDLCRCIANRTPALLIHRPLHIGFLTGISL